MGPLQTPRPAIAWHRRLEARVLVAVAGAAVVVLGVVLAATGQIVTRYSVARSASDLVSARAAFDRLVQNRAEVAARETRLIAELPTFRDSLIDSKVAADEATISGVAANYCGELGADFCLVADPQGRWLGGAQAPESARVALQSTIAAARAPASERAVIGMRDGLFLVVAEPALFGHELLGVFVSAYRVDDRMAGELAFVTHSDVTFVCGGESVCGSSLRGTPRAALAGLLARQSDALGAIDAAPALRRIGGATYVGGMYSLRGSPSGTALVLLQDWAPTARAIADSHTVLLWIGAAVLIAAVLGTIVFSRRITRPLRDLAGVADDVARGHWERRVPVSGPSEARTTAVAFNHMTATLTHWHTQALARERDLQVGNERFRAVTDSATDAIISTDAAGAIVFWNKRAELLFGYADREIAGQPITRLVPDAQRAAPDSLAAVFVSGDERRFGRPVEVLGRRRDGSEVPLELSLSSWSAGQDRFFTGIIRDVTDRKQAAEALRQREEQLRQAQKMEAIGRLAGGVAHDFNNLLTSMLGYSDLMLAKLPAEHPVRADVIEIQKAGRMAASLTRDLLAFGRKQVLQPVVLDLNAVIEDAANLLRHLLGEGIEVVLELDPALRPIRADRSQITQVLLNLAANARDAMIGGGRVTIRTTSEPAASLDPAGVRGPGHVRLSVSDTGAGMTEEVRSHIFEPFFTTKAVGKGTGLGLATVYGVVKQSGGQIWVDSAHGHGAAFHLRFPATEAAASEPAADPPAETASAGRPHLSETVLLVEDNDGVRTMARNALVADGYVVIEARNGDEALRLTADALGTIALVLTDVIMPVMGGRELASRLRALRPDIKIVFTSGYAEEVVVAEHVLDNAAGFIQKPFVPALLGRTIRRVLEKQSAGSAAAAIAVGPR